MFCPSALSMTTLKLHKKLAMDNTFTQEKLLPLLTFNPGFALTGFRTTRPRTFECWPINQSSSGYQYIIHAHLTP